MSSGLSLDSPSLAAAKAWTTAFRGNASDALKACITEMNANRNRGKLFGSSLSLVQSSGTGKSRTVDEVAREIFTFPFCLRETDDTSGSSGACSNPLFNV
jgi:hypothetical protein